MNGELAQLVALAAHGNAFLAGLEGEAPELEAGAAFRYDRSLEFVDGETVLTTTANAGRSRRRVGRRLRVDRRGGNGVEKHFEQAAQLLGAPDPVIPCYGDVLPPRGYGLDARQLLAAVNSFDPALA